MIHCVFYYYFRVSRLLILLAELDKHCVNITDCDIKLRGIEAILELGTLNIEIEIGNHQSNGGSPRLMDPIRAKPEFISHLFDCPCYHCSNVDYQIQALQAITLRSSFCVSNNSVAQAKQLFKGKLPYLYNKKRYNKLHCFNIFNILVGKELIHNIHKRHENTCKEVVTSLIDSEIRFYIEAVNALGRWNMLPKAAMYIEKAMNRLKEMHSLDQNLKNCLLQQETIVKWTQDDSHLNIIKGIISVL